MAQLGQNHWGKSEVRVSKVLREDSGDMFLDLSVQVLLTGDVADAFVAGDNSGVLPTDTTKNTVYGLAQSHLTEDLEAFATVIGDHMMTREGIATATVTVQGKKWARQTDSGFIGGSSERRTARAVVGGSESGRWSGIEGLVVLKTTDSAFIGFPRDEFTILPEADDRVLATSVTAEWVYSQLPDDTTTTWERVRSILIERFFGDWSASVQHQGWMMAESVLELVPEIAEISFRLPNQHHLPFDLTRFGLPDEGIVFLPVSEPYGDIQFTAVR